MGDLITVGNLVIGQDEQGGFSPCYYSMKFVTRNLTESTLLGRRAPVGVRDSCGSSVEDAVDKGHSGIHAQIVISDINTLVSVDMRVLKSGRLCRPGQHSLGGV